jgi:hypothetical protein
MALKLSEADHRALDRYLEEVLDAYKDGKIDLLMAREDLSHAVSAAAIDNPGFRSFIRTAGSERWEL